MPSDRDLKVARLALRLHVGEDGDPLDNDILNAYEALPESTIIRNDWIRRRLVIGHLLEREGISGLLAVIGNLSGGSATPIEPSSTAGFASSESDAVPAAYKAPEFNDGPAAEIEQRVSAPAPKEASSAKKKMFGLMPVIPVAEDPAANDEAGGMRSQSGESERSAAETASTETASDGQGKSASESSAQTPGAPAGESVPPVQSAKPDQNGVEGARETKPRVRIDPAHQPVIRIPTADEPELLAANKPAPSNKPALTNEPAPSSRPVPTDPVDDTRAMLERFAVEESEEPAASQGAGFNPVLEPDFQD